MRLAWFDHVNSRAGSSRRLYILPRNRNETRGAYVARFFEEIRGLGHVGLALVNNRRHRVIAWRGY